MGRCTRVRARRRALARRGEEFNNLRPADDKVVYKASFGQLPQFLNQGPEDLEPENLQIPFRNLIGRNYKIIERIGQGAFGCVFKAIEIDCCHNEKEWAIKIVPIKEQNQTRMKMLIRETSIQYFTPMTMYDIVEYELMWIEDICNINCSASVQLLRIIMEKSGKFVCMKMELCRCKYSS